MALTQLSSPDAAFDASLLSLAEAVSRTYHRSSCGLYSTFRKKAFNPT